MPDLRYAQLEALVVDPTSLPQVIAALADESWRVRRLAADKLSRVEATPQLVAALIFMLGQQHEPGTRNAAAMVLGQLGAAAVDPLVQLLEHSEADQRKFAAEILGALRMPEAVSALIHALADRDANVQSAAAEALGNTGGPQATRALERLLASPDPLLRVAALEGLASLRAPPALPTLRELIDHPLTRRSAHRALGLIHHPAAWALIIDSLRGLKSRDVALVALCAKTGRLPADLEPDLVRVLRHMSDAREWLTSALTATDANRRFGALHLVPALGDPSLAIHVAAAAVGAEAASLALEVLMRLGLPGALALLDADPPAITHLTRDARAVAGEALLNLAAPALVEPLVRLLHAGDDDLADLAARALGRSGAIAAIAPLVALFADDALAMHAKRALMQLAQSWPLEVKAALSPVLERGFQPHAVRSWGAIAGPAAGELLLRALHHEHDAVRAAAAEAIVSSTRQASEILGQALVDESPRVRRAATRALGSLRYSELAPSLLARALVDHDVTVVAAACTAAGELGAAETLPRLKMLSTHPEVSVVLSALEALATLGALTDEVLLAACAHPDPEVVKQSLTLGAARSAIIERAHVELEHPRWDVRVAAARALAVGGAFSGLDELRRAAERENDTLARELIVAAADFLAGR